MRSFTLEIDERNFNLLWRSLADREAGLEQIIKDSEDDEESEEGPMAANDLMYLRLYKKQLEEYAKKAVFDENAFSLSDEIIDISKL